MIFGNIQSPDRSVDSVVAWFHKTTVDPWSECFRVLKPGGHAVVLAEPTAYHRVAAGIEDAGFEIRDQIIWLREQHRSIVLARKPLIGTVASNVSEWGTGALNIDATRVVGSPDGGAWGGRTNAVSYGGGLDSTIDRTAHEVGDGLVGRWPANVIHDGSDGVVNGFPIAGKDTAARFFAEATTWISLFRYLIRLITPPNGVVLNPYHDFTITAAIEAEGMTQAGGQ